MNYQALKRYLWPHTLGPLGVVVMIDYVTLIGGIVQALLGLYIAAQIIMFIVGFAAAALSQFSENSPWGTIFNYNITNFFPLMDAGAATFKYLMTEKVNEKPSGAGTPDNIMRDAGAPTDVGRKDAAARMESGGAGDGDIPSEGEPPW